MAIFNYRDIYMSSIEEKYLGEKINYKI